MPTGFWGGNIQGYPLDFNDIYYYVKPMEGQGKTWEDVPEEIKDTFDKLGIPEAERKFLAGVGAQYDSEVVYHKHPRGPREARRHLPGHGHAACASTRTIVKRVLRHDRAAGATTSSRR